MFTRHGFAGVGLEEIAVAAGVTRGAVYHHFVSKKGLFVAVAESTANRVAQAVVDAADDNREPWDAVAAGCRAFLIAILADDARQILLLDAPTTLGWNTWRQQDSDASGRHLEEALESLVSQQLLVTTSVPALTALLSGALNEAALWVAGSPNRDIALDAAWGEFERLLHGLNERTPSGT
ncbi:TetR family transcriptional regulator [Rhodococcoides trifolii]|uniref:TetR family transcriptional regulator n=1 Tax=Rhodococcoides trifolii TaxID=908250 RepID=A0A917LGB9_9NOCA|nr:TetR family transcriptional regulator [Rhodococcus trifolii]